MAAIAQRKAAMVQQLQDAHERIEQLEETVAELRAQLEARPPVKAARPAPPKSN